jgi:hypothetical protein
MSGSLVLAALAALLLGALVLEHLAKRHTGRVLAWRWLSGHTLDGVHRTTAGWFTAGDRVLHPTGKASRWHHLPRSHRAVYRTTATATAALGLWGLAEHRTATEHGLAVAAAATAALGLWAAARTVAQYRHDRAYVRPLHHALAPVVGHAVAARPASWLTVPRGFQRRQGAVISVQLPRHFAGAADAKRAVIDIVCGRLSLENPGVEWKLAGASPAVQFTVQVPPPSKVRFADVIDLIRNASPTAPFIGLGRGGAPLFIDLENDSPHILISAGSGGGKSMLLRAIAAQILHNGGVVLCLDIKRLSHAFLRGLPGVKYARSIAEIHDALIALRGEIDQRNELADSGADEDGSTDHVDVGPRLLIIAEELNSTSARLSNHWRSIRTSSDANTSPAVESLSDAIFLGRQVRVTCAAAAQLAVARSLGGGEVRENFGARCLSRYSVQAARILCPEIWPFPRSSRHPGRFQICIGGIAHETQTVMMSAREAREWAMSGAVATFPAEGAPIAAANVSVLAERRQPISLSQAVADGVVSLELAALRSARARDPEFPAAHSTGNDGAHLYDAGELRRWEANRPRAQAAAAAGE